MAHRLFFLVKDTLSLIIIFIKTLFFQRSEAVLGSQEHWREGTEISHTPLLPCMHNIFHYPRSPPVWMLLQLIQLHWHVIITQSS